MRLHGFLLVLGVRLLFALAWLGLGLISLAPVFAAATLDASRFIQDRPSLLTATDVAVIYNQQDAQSEAVARYYA